MAHRFKLYAGEEGLILAQIICLIINERAEHFLRNLILLIISTATCKTNSIFQRCCVWVLCMGLLPNEWNVVGICLIQNCNGGVSRLFAWTLGLSLGWLTMRLKIRLVSLLLLLILLAIEIHTSDLSNQSLYLSLCLDVWIICKCTWDSDSRHPECEWDREWRCFELDKWTIWRLATPSKGVIWFGFGPSGCMPVCLPASHTAI